MIKGSGIILMSLKAGKMISENLYELISTILYYEIVTPPDAKMSYATNTIKISINSNKSREKKSLNLMQVGCDFCEYLFVCVFLWIKYKKETKMNQLIHINSIYLQIIRNY